MPGRVDLDRFLPNPRSLARLHTLVSRPWLLGQTLLLLVCLGAYALATAQVHAYEAGVTRRSLTLNGHLPTPMLVFAPSRQPLNVIAVIAHGYSANKEMMSAFGVDLAKQGVTTYTFDFPGHGASTLGYHDVAQLVEAVDEVVHYALAHAPAPQPKLALIGYSLGTIAVGEFALQHPELKSLTATILVAGILQDHPTVSNPRNLLVLSGQFDLPGINDISASLVASGCGVSAAVIASTYQCDASGLYGHRARIILPGLNHISIVTATSTHTAVIHWLGQYVDQRIGTQPVNADVRLHWLLVGFLAAALGMLPLLALGAAITGLRVGKASRGAASELLLPLIGRAVLLGLGLALAAALPLLHAVLPSEFWASPTIPFLRQQVAPDVALFLLLAGAFLVGGIAYVPPIRSYLVRQLRQRVLAQLTLALVAATYLYATLGSLSSFAWEGLTLTPSRAWRAVIYALMLWPFFFGMQLLLGAVAARKVTRTVWTEAGAIGLLTASLIAAIIMNFVRLSYLGILLPMFVIVLLAMVGANAWTRRVAAPSVVLLATTETLLLAWALAATLPLTG